MSNKIITGKKSRALLIKGVNKVADPVKVTLGAKGRNVIYEDHEGNPQITKDGVTVAKTISLRNKFQNLGASMVKAAALNTLAMAGDGTTTVTVLVQSLVNRGDQLLDNDKQKIAPISLKRGLDKAAASAIKILKGCSREVDSLEQLKSIATISANNDAEIGHLIADAVDSVGKHGIVTLEPGDSAETKLGIVEGMELSVGYIHPFLITDQSNLTAVLEDAFILIYDGKMTKNQKEKFLPMFSDLAESGQPILLIAEEYDYEMLPFILKNHEDKVLKICAISAPGHGDNRNFLLEDLAVITGGMYVKANEGYSSKFDEYVEHGNAVFGKAAKIVIGKHKTTIIGGAGDPEKIQLRANNLESQLQAAEGERTKLLIQQRLASLQNGLAIIKVGGITEVEIKEKIDRFDDALRATKSAQEEGYVAGGGSTLLWIADRLAPETKKSTITEELAYELLIEVLREPFRQLLINADVDPQIYIDNPIRNDYGIGYNIVTDEFGSMFDFGIIDPTKVLRVAIENSVSIAGALLTTEAAITREDYHG